MVNTNKSTLISKYGLQIDQLDYNFIENCKNAKLLEKILIVLRSGEEGIYPDLLKFCENRLKAIDPNSRLLHPARKILNYSDLPENERYEIGKEIQSWSEQENDWIKEDTGKNVCSKLPPVRGAAVKIATAIEVNKSAEKEKMKGKKCTPRSYSYWDKFNVEEELEKLDKKENSKPSKKVVKKHVELPKLLSVSDLAENERKYVADLEKNKGNEAFKARDYEEAIVYYTRSLSAFKAAATLNNRAQAYIKVKNYFAAIHDCTEVLVMEPENIKAFYRRGIAYKEEGIYDLAKLDFKILLELDPENKLAKDQLKQIKHLKAVKPVNKKVIIEEVDTINEKEEIKNENEGTNNTEKCTRMKIEEVINVGNNLKFADDLNYSSEEDDDAPQLPEKVKQMFKVNENKKSQVKAAQVIEKEIENVSLRESSMENSKGKMIEECQEIPVNSSDRTNINNDMSGEQKSKFVRINIEDCNSNEDKKAEKTDSCIQDQDSRYLTVSKNCYIENNNSSIREQTSDSCIQSNHNRSLENSKDNSVQRDLLVIPEKSEESGIPTIKVRSSNDMNVTKSKMYSIQNHENISLENSFNRWNQSSEDEGLNRCQENWNQNTESVVSNTEGERNNIKNNEIIKINSKSDQNILSSTNTQSLENDANAAYADTEYTNGKSLTENSITKSAPSSKAFTTSSEKHEIKNHKNSYLHNIETSPNRWIQSSEDEDLNRSQEYWDQNSESAVSKGEDERNNIENDEIIKINSKSDEKTLNSTNAQSSEKDANVTYIDKAFTDGKALKEKSSTKFELSPEVFTATSDKHEIKSQTNSYLHNLETSSNRWIQSSEDEGLKIFQEYWDKNSESAVSNREDENHKLENDEIIKINSKSDEKTLNSTNAQSLENDANAAYADTEYTNGKSLTENSIAKSVPNSETFPTSSEKREIKNQNNSYLHNIETSPNRWIQSSEDEGLNRCQEHWNQNTESVVSNTEGERNNIKNDEIIKINSKSDEKTLNSTNAQSLEKDANATYIDKACADGKALRENSSAKFELNSAAFTASSEKHEIKNQKDSYLHNLESSSNRWIESSEGEGLNRSQEYWDRNSESAVSNREDKSNNIENDEIIKINSKLDEKALNSTIAQSLEKDANATYIDKACADGKALTENSSTKFELNSEAFTASSEKHEIKNQKNSYLHNLESSSNRWIESSEDEGLNRCQEYWDRNSESAVSNREDESNNIENDEIIKINSKSDEKALNSTNDQSLEKDANATYIDKACTDGKSLTENSSTKFQLSSEVITESAEKHEVNNQNNPYSAVKFKINLELFRDNEKELKIINRNNSYSKTELKLDSKVFKENAEKEEEINENSYAQITPYEFLCTWLSKKSIRDSSIDAEYLLKIKPEDLPNIISYKLDASLLYGLLKAIYSMCKMGKYREGENYLRFLSQVPRIKIASMFLTEDETQGIQHLFSNLEDKHKIHVAYVNKILQI